MNQIPIFRLHAIGFDSPVKCGGYARYTIRDVDDFFHEVTKSVEVYRQVLLSMSSPSHPVLNWKFFDQVLQQHRVCVDVLHKSDRDRVDVLHKCDHKALVPLFRIRSEFPAYRPLALELISPSQ